MTITTIGSLGTKVTWYGMNQSEAFFFARLWNFPTGGGRENTNKKPWTVHASSIFNQKNENKDKDKL